MAAPEPANLACLVRASPGRSEPGAERIDDGLDNVGPAGHTRSASTCAVGDEKDLGPCWKREFGGNDDHHPLCAFGDQMERELVPGVGKPEVANPQPQGTPDPNPAALNQQSAAPRSRPAALPRSPPGRRTHVTAEAGERVPLAVARRQGSATLPRPLPEMPASAAKALVRALQIPSSGPREVRSGRRCRPEIRSLEFHVGPSDYKMRLHLLPNQCEPVVVSPDRPRRARMQEPGTAPADQWIRYERHHGR